MYCSQCGTLIANQNQYCTNCGHPSIYNIQSKPEFQKPKIDNSKPEEKWYHNENILGIIAILGIWSGIQLFLLIIFSTGIFSGSNMGAENFWPFSGRLENYDITEFLFYIILFPPLFVLFIFLLVLCIGLFASLFDFEEIVGQSNYKKEILGEIAIIFIMCLGFGKIAKVDDNTSWYVIFSILFLIILLLAQTRITAMVLAVIFCFFWGMVGLGISSILFKNTSIVIAIGLLGFLISGFFHYDIFSQKIKAPIKESEGEFQFKLKNLFILLFSITSFYSFIYQLIVIGFKNETFYQIPFEFTNVRLKILGFLLWYSILIALTVIMITLIIYGISIVIKLKIPPRRLVSVGLLIWAALVLVITFFS